MFKYIFLLVNTITVLVYNLLFGDGVSITPKFPDKAKPNSEFVAEIIVNKSNVSGFAKLQIELPEGLTAKELDNKGSTFSCTNGIVKFIWTALPAEESFVLKFNVTADGTCSGTKDIKGKFSYLLNNEKKQNEFGPVQIAFSEDVAQSGSNSPTTNSANSSANSGTSSTSSSNSTTSTSSDFNPVKKENEPLSIHRKITRITDNSYRVEVVFLKDNILGFAKHTEKIPEGFKAKEEKSSGASFNANQTFVKYLWASLPDKEEVRISYIIEQVATPPANGVVKGEFIYLDQEETKKVYSDEDAVPLSAPIAAATSNQANQTAATNTNSSNSNQSASTTTSNSTASGASVAKQPSTTTANSENVTGVSSNNGKTNNSQESATNSSNASSAKANQSTNSSGTNATAVANNASSNKSNNTTVSGIGSKPGSINYHVQIGAYKNNVTTEKVAAELNLTDIINSDMHEGLNKFLVGNYSEYKEARNKRETLRSGKVKDAFVSAYNGPKRVTVQEALMITSQKWAP